MRVATHNIKVTLPDRGAAAAVRQGLDYAPDLFGIQETGRNRADVLRLFGTVVLFPRLNKLWRRHPDDGWLFAYPRGGQPWAIDAAKYELDVVRAIQLSAGRGDVRPTSGTEIVVERRTGGRSIAALSVHPVAHRDRPENAAAGREAEDAICEWADSWTGYDRYVVGDFNDATVRIPDLFEAPNPGTFNDRPIDKIFGPRPWVDSTTFTTPSDHDGFVADDTKEIR